MHQETQGGNLPVEEFPQDRDTRIATKRNLPISTRGDQIPQKKRKRKVRAPPKPPANFLLVNLIMILYPCHLVATPGSHPKSHGNVNIVLMSIILV